MARLTSYVHVPVDDGGYAVYGPDDDVPAEHAKLIGPHAWEGADGADVDGVPARAGKGSGRDVWAAFAAEHGVDVSDEDSRDDLIAKCEQAGVVEPA
jgi:hypothetical protein